MIIDDNHISVDGICHNIGWSDLNAEVVCKAYDGQQALNYLQNNPVDLIISDIEMPQLDGLSLEYELRKLCSALRKGRQTQAEAQHMAQQGAYHPHKDSAVFQKTQALGNHRP